MVYIDSIGSVSDLVRNRAAAMWIKTRRVGQKIIARVTPYGSAFGHKEKDRREVTVDLITQTAECFSIEDGTQCEANYYGNLCCHLYKTLQQIAINQRRRAACKAATRARPKRSR